jgi:hypothetical protein
MGMAQLPSERRPILRGLLTRHKKIAKEMRVIGLCERVEAFG